MARDFTKEQVRHDAVCGGIHSGDPLHDRAHALEEVFFAKRERDLVTALRQKMRREREIEKLAAQCGIADLSKVAALADCGIDATTLPALILTPLLAVAWADGELEPHEREALVGEALKHRIVPGSEAWKLLQSWLAAQPPDALFDAWIGYVRELGPAMTPEDRAAFSREILEMARDIAKRARTRRRFNLSACVDELCVLDKIERTIAEINREPDASPRAGGHRTTP